MAWHSSRLKKDGFSPSIVEVSDARHFMNPMLPGQYISLCRFFVMAFSSGDCKRIFTHSL